MSALQALLEALPHAPDYTYDWSAIGSGPLRGILEKMDETPQDPEWHGEGSVGSHTRMVCEALAKLPAFRILPERKQCALALAALLHDMGKIRCTRFEDGCWVSPGHSVTGMRMAREMLWKDFELCGTQDRRSFRETVCMLVRWHMLPVHILNQEERDMERRLLEIAADGKLIPDFNIELLCMLSEADVLGRIAKDTEELLDLISLCRQAAQEVGCLNGPGSFADAYTQRAYFKGRNVWREQKLYNDSWGEVILLSGLPGTGKDTWIHACCSGLPVVSLDEIRRQLGVLPTETQGRVAQAAHEQARKYLREKQPFVWNATNLTKSTRGKLIDLFENYGASVRVVYLETDWNQNLQRNAQRAAAVPQMVIENMLGKLVLPQSSEAQRVEWMCV